MFQKIENFCYKQLAGQYMFYTVSNKKVDFLNPDPELIDIHDIAHSLSFQCRFTGHMKTFYSVAEHSMLVADLCPKESKLHGLLHDATEAYLGDVSHNLKKLLPFYKTIEKRWEEAISKKFDFSLRDSVLVKKFDNEALAIEKQSFKNRQTYSSDIHFVREQFLEKYYEYRTFRVVK